MKKGRHIFTVTGDGPFPLDMLRHGMCWPLTQHDVQQINPGVSCQRDVRLQSNHLAPDSNRWESMGWKVYDSRRERIPNDRPHPTPTRRRTMSTPNIPSPTLHGLTFWPVPEFDAAWRCRFWPR